MAERLFGVETEYALAALTTDHTRASRDVVAETFHQLTRQLPHLPDRNSRGVFLANGARFYVDSGFHPEFATPECANPWDVCRYIQAGDQVLLSLATELTRRVNGLTDTMVFRSNVDYTTKASWGCHESYLHRADQRVLPKQLIPHLVTRIIYTGAGGFNALTPGLEFVMSPRVPYLSRSVSSESTHDRGIYHTRDEPLCNGGHCRLHIICGESLFSETATWLKMATTTLVVAMIEAGLNPGDPVQLREPLSAMRRIASDPTCGAKVRLLDGSQTTAIGIQWHYLHTAEANRHHPLMPPWTGEALHQWRNMLMRLEQGAPDSVATTLDWAIKLALYRDQAQRRNMSWESLASWSGVLTRLSQLLEQTEYNNAPLTADLVLGNNSPIRQQVALATPTLESAGLAWDGFRTFLDLRHQLFETDTRFSQLGKTGIFSALGNAGVLCHHFRGVDNIPHAVANPPSVGRAKLRGECIQRFMGRSGHYQCDWTGVWDLNEARFLDLSQPFPTREEWKTIGSPEAEPSAPAADAIPRVISRAQTAYNKGDYEGAFALLQTVANVPPEALPDGYFMLRAWTETRRGFLGGGNAVQELMRRHGLNIERVCENLFLCVFMGLAPHPRTVQWIQQGLDIMIQTPYQQSPDELAAFRTYQGSYLLYHGDTAEALATLRVACSPDAQPCPDIHLIARNLTLQAEAHRLLGNRASAQRCLSEAQQLQIEKGYEGDLAEFTFTARARFETDAHRALEWLARAKAIQTGFHHGAGEVRTLLLEARVAREECPAETIKARVMALRSQLPALNRCWLLAKVLENWSAWVSGADPAGQKPKDFFWGV
ncbi:MAG: proteasome accessory factor PafA2 family protein [Verrucomicrobia bacterium]|nr:proteasome accessory factor PafA2 family protein [Verrucomicrobiota bacterium]